MPPRLILVSFYEGTTEVEFVDATVHVFRLYDENLTWLVSADGHACRLGDAIAGQV